MYPGPTTPTSGCSSRSSSAPRPRGPRDRARRPRHALGREASLPDARPQAARARDRPDVVDAHFLVPSGLIAALVGRAPLVVTAHGRDVRNVGSIPASRPRRGCRAPRGRCDLRLRLPAARARGEAPRGPRQDRGRLERRRPRAVPRDRPAARRPPAFLCVGALDERKNVLRLATPSRGSARGRALSPATARCAPRSKAATGVRLLGRVPHDEFPRLIAEAGRLRSRAWSSRSGRRCSRRWPAGVPSSRRGSEARRSSSRPSPGVLVDPLDDERSLAPLVQAAELPSLNPGRARPPPRHDVRLQAERLEAILEPGGCSRSASLTSTSGRTGSSSPASAPPRAPPRSSPAPSPGRPPA